MKTINTLFTLVLALSFCSASAQLTAPGIEWETTIGGNSYDFLYSIVQTSDGGYIFGGTSQSGFSGDKTVPLKGLADFWVVKLNSAGNIEWQASIGGSSGDGLYSIQQTSDGGYILGGESYSDISGDKTEANQGPSSTSDYWVVKLNNTGVIEWQNTIGGSSYDELRAIQQTVDGGYILGGYSWSDISGDKTEASFGNGYQDYWVVKLNSTGGIEWQKTIGGDNDDELSSIQQTSDGGYILGGYSASGISGNKTEANKGPYYTNDYWVVKLNNTGTIEWQNTIGGDNVDYLQSVQQTSDGGYILGGYSYSGISGDKTEASVDYDCWVIKLSTTGTIEWQSTIGGSDGDALYSIQQTSDGEYILGGYSGSGISGDKTEASFGSGDYWIVKLDNVGTIKWQTTIGGDDDDALSSIQSTSDGGYIIGGSSKSNISGDKTEANNGPYYTYDCWVVKLYPENAITTGSVSGSPFCPETPLNVPFTSVGAFNAGNIYTAQLSDKKGMFTSPVVIGTLSSNTNSGTITATIPSSPKAGTKYRIRVTSSDPIETGSNNGANLQLIPCGSVTALSVSGISATAASLDWTGVFCAVKYRVQYRKQGTTSWKTKFSITDSYTITGLLANTIYEYRIQTYCSESGSAKSAFTPIQTFTTTLRLASGSASAEETMTIYPNPAVDHTTIQFTLSQSSHVCIRVYEISGKEIATLLNDNTEQGNYSIPLKTYQFSKGVYLVKMITDSGIENQKLIVQ